MIKKVSILVLVLTLVSGSVFAFEPSPWKKEGDSYPVKMKNKFAYGFSNVLLGWTEIFQEPYEAVKEKKCPLTGFGRGLWNAVGDTVGGAVHLVTFWCPKTDIPLPEGGIKPCACGSSMKQEKKA